MVLVAIVAVNIAVTSNVLDYANPYKELLLMGSLPMANTLVMGLATGCESRSIRGFLVGFEAFGVTALCLFIGGISLFPDLINLHYRLLYMPFGRSLTMILLTVVMIGLPQLAFALLGGFLTRNFGNSPQTHRARRR
jgi:hypothetical protein